MLDQKTIEQLNEINRKAMVEMSRVETGGFGADKIDIKALYEVVDTYEQANQELLKSAEFRNALREYSSAQDSVEGAVQALQQFDYSVDKIEPILQSTTVAECVARLEHDAVSETGDSDVDEAVDNIIDKTTDSEHQREKLFGYAAVVADHLTKKAMEQHESINLTREEQAAVVFIIMFAILSAATGGVASITGAAASAVGFDIVHQAAEKRAERLELE